MPTITLFSSGQQLQVKECVPGANLVQSLSALASSSKVAPPYTFKVYNPDRDQLRLTSARCLGTQPLEAEVESAAAAAMQAEILDLESEMTEVKQQLAYMWAPRVRNLAAQLLLLACERETLRKTTTGCFRQMGVENEGVRALTTNMAVEPAHVVKHADDVISRQKSEIRFGSLAELEQEVHDVQRSMTPQLQAHCCWECKFIKTYLPRFTLITPISLKRDVSSFVT